ncbi:MAG: hypothetical protein WC871_02230 [Bacteroidales bacterium]|jgi:hypothetical protein
MHHTVILFEPGKLPRFMQNVTSLRHYKKNPYAVIDPKELPPEELKYWQMVSRNKLGYYKSAAKRKEVDDKVTEILASRRR